MSNLAARIKKKLMREKVTAKIYLDKDLLSCSQQYQLGFIEALNWAYALVKEEDAQCRKEVVEKVYRKSNLELN